MKDIRLDPRTHNLLIRNHDLTLLHGEDDETVMQKLKIRLLFFFGEWFLSTSVGIPFYENILKKNPYIPSIDTIIKSTILETYGVKELSSYSSSYDNVRRKLNIEFQARTIYGGTLSFSGAIP